MGRVVTTALDSALDALGNALQRPDPLDPAMVICASPMVAVGVRRALGSRPSGVAGVAFMTFDRLAEDLGRPLLASVSQHQAGPLELQAAIRAELAASPGLFGSVAAHRTTEERLIDLDHQVIGLPREEFDRLIEAPGLSGDAFRVLRAAANRLGSARVASHVVQLATEEIEKLPVGERGPIVVYLPEPSLPHEARLLVALARRDDCTVIVGLTGHPEIDLRHRQRLAGIGLQIPAVDMGVVLPSGELPTARVLEVADPEDEVRSAIRELVAWAAAGTPLSKMALLYTTTDPYASLIEELLSSADLPYSAPGHRSLATSLAGRTLLRLLGLADTGLERASLITLVSSAPIQTPSGLAPATLWDRISRQAGVVDGDDWQDRVSTVVSYLDEDKQQAAHDLIAFTSDLAARLDPEPCSSWEEWSAWITDLLRSLLRVDDSWPEHELVAFDRVVSVVAHVRRLDRIDPEPSFETFAATVAGELESLRVPGRPAGQGLLVAPIASAAGLSFTRLVVVGLAEGSYPRVGREDSLLSDQVRARAGHWLLPSKSVPDLDTRAVTALVAAAGRSLLTTARGDLRSRRSKVWPRALDHLVDERVVVESHYRGLVDHARPGSLHDLGLRSLIRHTDSGEPVHTHGLARLEPLAAGLARHLDRQKPGLTRHSGRVRAGRIDVSEQLFSPTAIEDYAHCPRRYLLSRVLRISDDERPERINEITARDRGLLMHEVLERFIAEVLAEGRVPEPDTPWGPEDQNRLLEVLERSVVQASATGLTGGRVQTAILQRELTREAVDFLATDNELRAARRSRPIAVEHKFGFDEAHELEIGTDHRLLMRGQVDRVDATDDEGLLVIDYKGGGKSAFSSMSKDPLDGGQRIQLPLYARIVAHEMGRTGPRTALYWLTKHDEHREMELTDELEDELDGLVTAALAGIADGLFPGVPGETVGWPRLTFDNCKWCDFDRLCPTDRQREWDGVQDDDILTPIDVLLGRER